MGNNAVIDYSKLFYRIENVVSYSLIFTYILILLIFYVIWAVKLESFFYPVFLFTVSFLSPTASITWVTPLFLFISILIVLSFYSDTWKDILKLKKQISKKRYTRRLRIKKEIIEDKKKIMPIPFYETFFMPRFRENPALNAVYMFYPAVYIIALLYIIIPIPALIVEYWEGRIIEIISIIYFFLFRIISRVISLLILSKLTTGQFRGFKRFREEVLKIRIYHETKPLYLITKEQGDENRHR